MTRIKVVMAAERNNVFFFITVRYLLRLDASRNSSHSTRMPDTKEFIRSEMKVSFTRGGADGNSLTGG